MKVLINRQLLGVEDLLVGEGTVTQPRGGQNVIVTKLNAASLPWGDGGGLTYQEALVAQIAIATTQAELATSNGAAQVALATIQAELATSNGAAQVALATTQAELATSQANIATTQANIATTQAGLATAQAELATSNGAAQVALATIQAELATTQANIAIDSAASALNSKNEAMESSIICAASINLAWYGFEVIDGELIVSYNDLSVSTPSLVDGDFIVTY